MSFPKSGRGPGGGGGGSSKNSGKAMRLLLGSDFIVNQDEIKKVEFDQIPFNDGFTFNADGDVEIEADSDGTVLITASVGVKIPLGMAQSITVGCLIFKNGQPLRQSSKTKLIGPYCIAEVSVIDKGVFEDKYSMYVHVVGGDELTATVAYSNGATALEIAYL